MHIWIWLSAVPESHPDRASKEVAVVGFSQGRKASEHAGMLKRAQDYFGVVTICDAIDVNGDDPDAKFKTYFTSIGIPEDKHDGYINQLKLGIISVKLAQHTLQ